MPTRVDVFLWKLFHAVTKMINDSTHIAIRTLQMLYGAWSVCLYRRNSQSRLGTLQRQRQQHKWGRQKGKNICLVYNLNVIKGHYGPCFSISTSLSSLAVASATKDLLLLLLVWSRRRWRRPKCSIYIFKLNLF